MIYGLTLIIALAGFLWKTPALGVIPEKTRESIQAVQVLIASKSAPLTAQAQSVAISVRSKIMEFLRKELHDAIDGLVR